MIEIRTEQFTLRPFGMEDVPSLTEHINNRKIWRNVRDVLPHPYDEDHARNFIKQCLDNKQDYIFAIDLNGGVAGAIGLHHKEDVYRLNFELGFWLGEPFWGRGIMTAVIGKIVDFAFTNTEVHRLYAEVFDHNQASMRVLTKNNFRHEAVLREAIIKDEKIEDLHVFAWLRSEWEAARP
jgi:ribosomal-protein-alanine N-acetyltransferase